MKWLRQLFFGGRIYRALSEEIQAHLDERTEELMADGMSREMPSRPRCGQFGNIGLIEEKKSQCVGVAILEDVLFDIRYGLRALRHSPVFTAVAL